jgi:hypothetical protein
VDHLKVGHKGPSEVAYGTGTYFNAIAVGELDTIGISFLRRFWSFFAGGDEVDR